MCLQTLREYTYLSFRKCKFSFFKLLMNCISKKKLALPKTKKIAMSSSRSFQLIDLRFWPISSQFWMWREATRLIFSYGYPVPPIEFVKRLDIYHWINVAILAKINWPYIFWFILSPLFYSTGVHGYFYVANTLPWLFHISKYIKFFHAVINGNFYSFS